MILPQFLIIDDQYGRDGDEWQVFLNKSGLLDINQSLSPQGAATVLGQATLCSGQRHLGGRIVNDYEVIREAVSARPAAGWSLVLIDATFNSGELGRAGIPQGSSDDQKFGEQSRTRLVEEFPGLPVLMLTSKHQQELSDPSLPYVSKAGLSVTELTRKLIQYGTLNPDQLRAVLQLPSDLIAEAPAMIEILRDVFLLSNANIPTLLLGESGVGKEMVAKYVHHLSKAMGRTGSFVPVNCAAIPAGLLESELFGHEAGAFTGASKASPGRILQANKGTLFLDEIGDLPPDLQPKLLRVLQEGELTPVGGRGSPIPVDVLLVSATSHDLARAISRQTFRADLYHRICTAPSTVPPLRDRREDIVPLARRFLTEFTASSNPAKKGVVWAEDALARIAIEPFAWNNVRELRNLIRRLSARAGPYEVIGLSSVESELNAASAIHRPAQVIQSDHDDTISKAIQEQPTAASSQTTLSGLASLLVNFVVCDDDPSLRGALRDLDAAYTQLMRHVMGAALERCRDPMTRVINRQRAVRLLLDDPRLKTSDPNRKINEVLGRGQTARISSDDLEELVAAWKSVCTPQQKK